MENKIIKKISSIQKKVTNKLVIDDKERNFMKYYEYLKNNGTINSYCNYDDVYYFLQFCIMENLNPIKKEAYCVKSPKTNHQYPIVNYEIFIRRALPKLKHAPSIYIHFKDNNNNIIDKTKWWAETTVTFKNGSSIMFQSIFTDFDKGHSTWKDQPFAMFQKCSIVNALRRSGVTMNCYVDVEDWTGNEEIINDLKKNIDMKEAEVKEIKEEENVFNFEDYDSQEN